MPTDRGFAEGGEGVGADMVEEVADAFAARVVPRTGLLAAWWGAITRASAAP